MYIYHRIFITRVKLHKNELGMWHTILCNLKMIFTNSTTLINSGCYHKRMGVCGSRTWKSIFGTLCHFLLNNMFHVRIKWSVKYPHHTWEVLVGQYSLCNGTWKKFPKSDKEKNHIQKSIAIKKYVTLYWHLYEVWLAQNV